MNLSQSETPIFCQRCGPGTTLVGNGSNNSKYGKVKQWKCKECKRTVTDPNYSRRFKSKIYDGILWQIMKPEIKNLKDVATAMNIGPLTLNKYIRRHGEYFFNRYQEIKPVQKTVSFTCIELRVFRLKTKNNIKLSHSKAGLINWFELKTVHEDLPTDTSLIDFLKSKKFDKYIMESNDKKVFQFRLAFFIRLRNSVLEYQKRRSVRASKDKMTAPD